jgi:serine/threonine-protein kinase
VFSLGIVLWELLAARPLFDAANDLLVLENVRHPKVDPPSRWLPSIPPSLDEVVLSALAENPDDRPASAQEFRRRLGEALPRALAVDPEALSELMIASMAEQIERDRAALPESVVLKLEGVSGGYTSPGVRPPVRPAAASEGEDEALKTMTLEALDIQLDELDQPPPRDDSPQPVVRTTSVQRVRDRSGRPWPLVAAAGGIAVAGVGGAFWLASQLMGTPPDAPGTQAARPIGGSPVVPVPVVAPPAEPPPVVAPAATLDAGVASPEVAAPVVAPNPEPDAPRTPSKRPSKRVRSGGSGPVLVQDDF